MGTSNQGGVDEFIQDVKDGIPMGKLTNAAIEMRRSPWWNKVPSGKGLRGEVVFGRYPLYFDEVNGEINGRD